MGKRILLVEDDKNFGSVLRDYLNMHDFDVCLKENGEEGLLQFNLEAFDLCVFDVMMPKKDGFTLAAEIVKLKKGVPFIFLTARGMKEDMIKGLKLGADDYITKPFDAEVLLLKINAILNRYGKNHPAEASRSIGSFHFDPHLRLIRNDHEEYRLSPKENALLQLLNEHKGNVLPRSTALIQIWEEDNYFTARSMDVHVVKLRKYFKNDPAISITNVHGSGYVLNDSVSG